jgi:hypothetical protein
MRRGVRVFSAALVAFVAGCGGDDNRSSCALDGSALTHQLPDGALADAGATAAACGPCLRSSCSPALAECGGDCSCSTAFVEAFDCYARTGVVNAPGCGPDFASVGSGGKTALADVFGCIFQHCEPECIGAGIFASLPDGSSLDP